MPDGRPSHITPAYAEYLGSTHWASIKREFWRHHGYCCTVCRSTETIDAHHLIYRVPLTDGRPTDLMPLCRRCHDIVHDNFLPASFAESMPIHERWRRTETFIRAKLKQAEERAHAKKPPFRTGPLVPNHPKRRGRWQDYLDHQRAIVEQEAILAKKAIPILPHRPIPEPKVPAWVPPKTARPSKVKRWFDL